MNLDWTGEFPTEVGNYWFFGFRSKLGPFNKAQLLLVKVRVGGDKKLLVSTEAAFVYKEDVLGIWAHATLPETPEDWEAIARGKN